MIEQICDIAADLIKFPSTNGRPRSRKACAEYIEKFFKERGVECTIWEPGDVRSLVVDLSRGAGPMLCLNGHYDVVEGKKSDFRPRVKGDYLFGRGSADMKASLAAMMVLITELAKDPKPPPVALMIVGDEEVGGERGSLHILNSGFKSGFAVVGEPTGLSIANQAKGLLGVELIIHGKSAHSARPWEGDNPVFTFFSQFQQVWEIFGTPEPCAWQTTMTPTVVSAGEAPNMIADRLSCMLDIRWVPRDDPGDILDKIKKAAPECEVKEDHRGVAFYTDPEEPGLVRLRETATGVINRDPGLIRKHAASDGRHFTSMGIPTAVFGPAGGNVHGDGEYVDLRQVAQFYKVLEKFCRET